ncbi:MAG: arginyl-tRNA synthetase [Desulfovibrionales bacterium]|nr:arginyl-tRNA synthetase [Desulfovibrionales bacterium]
MRAKNHLEQALVGIVGEMGLEWPTKATVEPPKDKKFGDLACNIAMMLAKDAGRKPRDLAEDIRQKLLKASPDIASVEVAGPGFLNVAYGPDFWRKSAALVLEQGENYGKSDAGQGRRVQVEYVSANPTGPLHIGHGRGAALGDCLARILARTGFEVQTEYYINDAGRQMKLLGASIWARLLEIAGKPSQFPEDGYKGNYIKDLAQDILDNEGPQTADLPSDQGLELCRVRGMNAILDGIKQDLKDFGVEHEIWFSEASLVETGKVQATLDSLKTRGMAYEKDGALWFKSTDLGDDKDRVLVKSSGDLTYLASDIAYHDNKYQRGFDLVVDIWGADHHGYVPRMKAAVEALGRSRDDLEVILVQLVNLLRGGEQIAMSTRAGKFETLADVVKEVGADAARFIFLSRKSDSHLDFDLELVKQKSMDNPVYYVQYAHARIRSVQRKAEEQGISLDEAKSADLSLLDTPEDMDLLKLMDQFPEVLASAAKSLSPHLVSYYLRELAQALHGYYTKHQVLGAGDDGLVRARLLLLEAVAQVLRNGLAALGVSAPDSM